jgi:eukaryotic-like serine/threonine-protein kinase
MEPLAPPEWVSHYRILNKLGSGGMGDVYLAEDTLLNRRVAIKFPRHASDDELRADRRLIREAHAAASLDHPNICAIYEVGEEAGHTFIVMQYVEGESLATRIRNGPPDLGECLEIAVQVADALAEAHSHGLIHRDIKPQNIIVTARHHAKVMDFGLAKIVLDRSLTNSEAVTESLLTEPGAMVGTLPYMSPEQVRGEELDALSDIFSFGALLYETITGNRPFKAESPAMTISAIVGKEPAPLARYSKGVPAELERIVNKALRKDRDERYQTAKDLLIDLRSLNQQLLFERALERSQSHETVEAERRRAVTTHDQLPDTGGSGATKDPATASQARGLLDRHPRVLLVAASTLILTIGVLAVTFYFAPTNETPADKAINSIAVLPLVNASGDADAEYLADGISESLINSLTELPNLRVIARTTAFRYKGKQIDPREVGRNLGVRAVLTGTLSQRGGDLDLQVDLVDAIEGSQIWGALYNRKATDLLAIRQELAREITDKLRLRLTGEDKKRLTKGDAGNTEAYHLFLRGRYFWNRRTAAGIKKAIEQFQQAIDKDPNYAQAYVGLADCYALLERYAGSPTSETLPKARAAVRRALQIDDSLAEAHTSLGLIEQSSWNFSEAENEFKRAIDLNPNYPTAHFWYNTYLRDVLASYDEGMAEARRALQLDPLSPVISNDIAVIHLQRGDLDAAVEAAKRALELDPNFPEAHRALGVTYRRLGRHDEALAELQKAVDFSGRQARYLTDLAVCYAVADDGAIARTILQELQEKYKRGEALGQHLASVYASIGDKEGAFAWLEKDFEARSGQLVFIAYSPTRDVLRDKLTDDPRWIGLLRRIGLPNL